LGALSRRKGAGGDGSMSAVARHNGVAPPPLWKLVALIGSE
jgi:hypothetical protein